jgi:hypothetical protein
MTRNPLALAVLFLSILAARPGTGHAQEEPRRLPTEPAPAPVLHGCEKCYTTYHLHWLQREVDKEQANIKDYTCEECKPTLKLQWPEQQVRRCELVLKPREIVKEVTCCTMKPTVETDPCTGCSVTVFKPVTETKRIKQLVYDLCPEEKAVRVQTGCLVPDIKVVKVKRLYLDWTHVKLREDFGVLVPCEVTERVFSEPPCCTAEPGRAATLRERWSPAAPR